VPGFSLLFETDVYLRADEGALLLEWLEVLAEEDAWPGDEDYRSLIPKVERALGPREGFRWTRMIRAAFDAPGDAVPLRTDAAQQVAHAWQHRDQLHSQIVHSNLPDTIFAESGEMQAVLIALEHAADDPRYGDGLRQLHRILSIAMPSAPGEHRRIPLEGAPDQPDP
jgi:hypothetical protein